MKLIGDLDKNNFGGGKALRRVVSNSQARTANNAASQDHKFLTFLWDFSSVLPDSISQDLSEDCVGDNRLLCRVGRSAVLTPARAQPHRRFS